MACLEGHVGSVKIGKRVLTKLSHADNAVLMVGLGPEMQQLLNRVDIPCKEHSLV